MAKMAKVVGCIRIDLQDMKVVEAARKANVKNEDVSCNMPFQLFYVYARTCFLIPGMYVYTSNNVYNRER